MRLFTQHVIGRDFVVLAYVSNQYWGLVSKNNIGEKQKHAQCKKALKVYNTEVYKSIGPQSQVALEWAVTASWNAGSFCSMGTEMCNSSGSSCLLSAKSDISKDQEA